jgi:hypothetical protein
MTPKSRTPWRGSLAVVAASLSLMSACHDGSDDMSGGAQIDAAADAGAIDFGREEVSNSPIDALSTAPADALLANDGDRNLPPTSDAQVTLDALSPQDVAPSPLDVSIPDTAGPVDADAPRPLGDGGSVPETAPATPDAAPVVDTLAPTPDLASDLGSSAMPMLDVRPDAVGPDGCLVDEFRSGSRCVRRVAQVATTRNKTCAVLEDGTVWCWGGTAFLSVPEMVPGISNARQIALGGPWGAGFPGSACVVTADERLLCWGTNNFGELGDGTGMQFESRSTPMPVLRQSGGPLTGVRAVGLGDYAGCAMTATEIVCWGINNYAQVGVPLHGPGEVTTDTGVFYQPKAIPVPGAPVGIFAGGFQHTVSSDGVSTVCGWGWNTAGYRFWPALSQPLFSPICSVPLKPIAQIAAGDIGNCFLHTDGEVRCVGFDLGVTDLPGARADIGAAKQVVAGLIHACALQQDGRVFCWGGGGAGGDGELGVRPVPLPRGAPYEIKSLGMDVARLGSGPDALHSCAIMKDGSLQCWGRNREGQLGNASAGQDPSGPVVVNWQ